MHKRTYRYRIYPTPAQERRMVQTLRECRTLYNHLLEERRDTYEREGRSPGLYDQLNGLAALKREYPVLREVHSQVLQDVAVRLDLAFKAFFRRVKAGEKPGYPRFKGAGRYNSFTYPQLGFRLEKQGKLSEGGRVFLSKIGHVKAAVHRPLEGTVKTATVRRHATGKWFVCIVCEVQPEPLPVSDEQVGVDLGLKSLVATSDGEHIEAPSFFRKEEKELARVQRRHSDAEKGSREREHRRKVVAKVHERIREKRRDFAHQTSRRLIDRYSFIAMEDLSVNRMLGNHKLAKSIADAAWTDLALKTSYKAESADRTFVEVNPAYTSQDCSNCGYRKVMGLAERLYTCPNCGLVVDRDTNAARNILTVGLHGQLASTKEPARSPRLSKARE